MIAKSIRQKDQQFLISRSIFHCSTMRFGHSCELESRWDTWAFSPLKAERLGRREEILLDSSSTMGSVTCSLLSGMRIGFAIFVQQGRRQSGRASAPEEWCRSSSL